MTRHRLIRVSILAISLGLAFSRSAVAADCIVADPTGTPLNVRAAPNGEILSRLGNGVPVVIVEERARAGKQWARVAVDGQTLGWVFAAYLDCSMPDDNLKSAPMRPRVAPQ